MKIAFLGLGTMGSILAERLIHAGHAVTVWNRSPRAADALSAKGGIAMPTAKQAIDGQELVLSMLFDDAAYEDLFLSDGGLVESMKPGQLHLALSTLSVALSMRLAEEHAFRGQAYVGAPVFGRPNVAAEGKLWIVLAGADDAVAIARPALESLSRGITVIGTEPWQAHALKLGGNFMIASMIQTLSEAMAFAKSQGIDAESFAATVNSALFQSPFYENYARVMLHPPEKPGATVQLGAKDTRLFREAGAAAGFTSGLAEFLAGELEQSIRDGEGDSDWPVSQYRAALKSVKAK
jgi:3-hydroxyisobutyrate dehydrogenase-like beta-hydroxyacid dehydrogenase